LVSPLFPLIKVLRYIAINVTLLPTLTKIGELVQFAKTDTTNIYRDVNFSIIPNFQAKIIEDATGIIVKGCMKYLTASGIRHAFNSHGNAEKEEIDQQIAVTDSDFEFIPSILSAPDSFEKGRNNRRGNDALLFKKKISNKVYHVVMSVVEEAYETKFMFNTMYIKKAGE
jgi:hypothetical protein